MTKSKTSFLVPALVGGLIAGCFAVAAWSDEKAPIATEISGSHAGHVAAAAVAPSGQSGEVEWDAKYAKDLEASLHHLHEIWNTGDIESLKKFIIGDDVTPTFELDPGTHKAIKLESKADFDRFISKVQTVQDDRNVVTELDMPKMHCRATATWGFCTEECTVKYKKKSGELVGVDKLLSTQVAVNTKDGWRWIQWHMSDARPPESVALH